MESISLISWEKHWEVRTRCAIPCYCVLTTILLIILFLVAKNPLIIIIAFILLVVFFVILLVFHYFSRIYVKSHQKIHTFTKHSITVIRKDYKLVPAIFKNVMTEDDQTSTHQEDQLKYLTSRAIKEEYPSFLGIPIRAKLLRIKWTYSNRHEHKDIILENIQEEDWLREKDTIIQWIEEERASIGSDRQSGV